MITNQIYGLFVDIVKAVGENKKNDEISIILLPLLIDVKYVIDIHPICVLCCFRSAPLTGSYISWCIFRAAGWPVMIGIVIEFFGIIIMVLQPQIMK